MRARYMWVMLLVLAGFSAHAAPITGSQIKDGAITPAKLSSAAAIRAYLGIEPAVNVPSVDGTGASGTWGISVSGTAATATALSNPGAQPFARVYNVKAYGAKGDGTTDDTAAIQAAVTAASAAGGGTVWLPAGTYTLTGRINWASLVSMAGEGAGRSVLKMTGSGYAAIYNLSGSTSAPLLDCTFRDFEIDGSAMTDATYSIASKGFFILYMKRARFVDVYVHDTPATGFGCDYLQETLFHGCVASNCGRLWDGSSGGAAGFGIGQGAWAVEDVTISDCSAIGGASGQWGIFFEYQDGQAYRSTGAKVVNCYVEGYEFGIGDRGSGGTLVSNCVIRDSAQFGVRILYGATGTVVDGCTIEGAGTHGVIVSDTAAGNITVRNNRVTGSAANGIALYGPAEGLSGYEISNNVAEANGANGIAVGGSTLSDLSVIGNVCRNNGQTNATYPYGIEIGATVTRLTLTGNACYDSQASKTQTYGLRIGAVTVTDSQVIANNLLGNKTGAFSNGGATLTNCDWFANAGDTTNYSRVTGKLGVGVTAAPSAAIDVLGVHVSGIGIARFKGTAGYGYMTVDTTTTGTSGFMLALAGTKKAQIESDGIDLRFINTAYNAATPVLNLGSTGLATFAAGVAVSGTAPASQTAAGATGEIRRDASYLYVCTTGGAAGAAHWKRVALDDTAW